MQSLPTGYQALILGATGAIGGALAAQLAADPRCAQVVVLSRQSTPAMDFEQPQSIATAAKALRPQGPWHLIVVATGMLSGPTGGPEKRLTDLNATHLAASFATNTIGPALALAHFAPQLAKGERSLLAVLSAKVGSIGDNRLGGWYSYRASKAALNMLLKTAAIEVARTHPQAVLAALYRRSRNGRGRQIELALYDCGITINGYYALDAMLLGHDTQRYGNAHPSIVPYGLFEAADGPLIIGVGNNRQFEAFCRHVIDRPDIFEDPRYATNVERARNRLEVLPMLKQIIAGHPRQQLLDRMHAVGIPCGEVAGLHEALTSQRTQQAGMFHQMPHPVAGQTWVFAPPYRLDGQRLPIRNAPPTLGEATREVLQQLLSMSDAQLQALKDKGVLTLPEQQG